MQVAYMHAKVQGMRSRSFGALPVEHVETTTCFGHGKNYLALVEMAKPHPRVAKISREHMGEANNLRS